MRSKYFLKGMGIGITVTALIFTIAFALNPPTLSDEDVIARAKALGMVEADKEEDTDEDSKTEETETAEDAVAGDEEAPTEETAAADEKGGTEGTSSGDNTKSEKSVQKSDTDTSKEEKPEPDNSGYKKKPETGESEKNTETAAADASEDEPEEVEAPKNQPKTTKEVEITVRTGEDSSEVAARLASTGAIADAADFDYYLSTHGFDRRIHPGTFTIPKGSTYNAIANVIAY